jgi:predicted tellurium resistance membrane protein TerC
MSELFAALCTSENLIALATLTGLEIVLGIDNIIFLSILTGKLPQKDRPKARFIGLSLAMGARVCLLLSITWVMSLTNPLFAVFGHEVSGKDLILILGGLFLMGKSTHEIHHKLEAAGEEESPHGVDSGPRKVSWAGILTQIVLIDIVFSLDSVITAVGMVNPASGAAHAGSLALNADGQAKLAVMIIAVVLSIIVMIMFAGRIGDFVEKHPTIKMLALSFLILIGCMLVAEGFGQHVNKGYIYFAMAFSLGVEMLNLWMRKKAKAKVGGITGTLMPHGSVIKEPPKE